MTAGGAGAGADVATAAADVVAGRVTVWRVVGAATVGFAEVTTGAGAGADPEPPTVKSTHDW